MGGPALQTSVVAAIGAGTFLTALHVSAVVTILPNLGSEWVMTAYLLALSGFLLTCGRLGDVVGHRRIYLSGLAIFLTASGLCAIAPSLPMLIGFRALQGIGTAMVSATSPVILVRTLPLAKRGRALGCLGMMTYLGLTVGPSLGGYVAAHWTWRAIFLLNLPIGVAAMVLAWVVVPSLPQRDGPKPAFDALGTLCWLGGLVPLLVALNKGRAWGWGSSQILALLIFAVISFAVFPLVERRTQHPLVDVSLFRRRGFWYTSLSEMLYYLCLYAIGFLVPLLLIQNRRMSLADTGFVLSTQSLARTVAAPFGGFLSDRMGTRLPATLGSTILGLGLGGLSSIAGHASVNVVASILAMVGIGTGIFVPANSTALFASAPDHQRGAAAGTLATARNMAWLWVWPLPAQPQSREPKLDSWRSRWSLY